MAFEATSMSPDLSEFASPASPFLSLITTDCPSPTSSLTDISAESISASTILSPSTEFVVAHFNENLSWLKDVKPFCKIYSKGGPQNAPPVDFEYEVLENNGREGQTYLFYICKHYDELKDVTIFTQGKAFDHTGMKAKKMMDTALATKEGQVTTFGTQRDLELFDLWEGIPWQDYPCWRKWLGENLEFKGRKAPKTPAQYLKEILGCSETPMSIGYQPGAIFAVRRETIRQYTKETYQKMLAELFEGEMKHNDPETGHYLERFWLAIFSPQEYCCWTEAEVSKVERNAQGQLAKGRWHKTPPGVEVDEGYTNRSDDEDEVDEEA